MILQACLLRTCTITKLVDVVHQSFVDTLGVEYLLSHSADPQAKDRWGGTALLDAEREGHKEIESLLKKHKGAKKASSKK